MTQIITIEFMFYNVIMDQANKIRFAGLGVPIQVEPTNTPELSFLPEFPTLPHEGGFANDGDVAHAKALGKLERLRFEVFKGVEEHVKTWKLVPQRVFQLARQDLEGFIKLM